MRGPAADPANVLISAASDLPLSSTQKSRLDGTRAELEHSEADVARAFKDLKADVVSGVRAGTIDTAKLNADEAAIDRAMQSHKAKEVESLNALHATLDPAQRVATVQAIRSKRAAYGGGPMGRTPSGAGNTVGAEEGNQRRLDRLTTDLGLDAAQQKQVAALLAQSGGPPTPMDAKTHRDEHQSRMDALLTAFQQDSFDANTLATPKPDKSPREFVHRHVVFVSQLLPILRPDQREKLAAKMDQPWMGMDMGPHGGDGNEGFGAP
jgi:Spy/CpxP family protein refolding chaperone